MFENPRRGRQARNFITNVPKILDLKSSSANRYFWKIDIGCPWLPALYPWKMFCHFWTDMVSVWMARGIRSKKNFIHLNGLGYLFGKNCRPFEQLVLSVPKKMSSVWTAWAVCLEKIVISSNGLGYPFQKLLSIRMARAIHSKKKLSTVGGTEPICSKINLSRVSIPKPFHL